MIKTNIQGIRISQLQERGKLPYDIKWSGELPPSYFISLIKKDNKTLVVCADGFGGGMAWAIVPQKLDFIGKEIEIDKEELDFVRRNYPSLYETLSTF